MSPSPTAAAPESFTRYATTLPTTIVSSASRHTGASSNDRRIAAGGRRTTDEHHQHPDHRHERERVVRDQIGADAEPVDELVPEPGDASRVLGERRDVSGGGRQVTVRHDHEDRPGERSRRQPRSRCATTRARPSSPHQMPAAANSVTAAPMFEPVHGEPANSPAAAIRTVPAVRGSRWAT